MIGAVPVCRFGTRSEPSATGAGARAGASNVTGETCQKLLYFQPRLWPEAGSTPPTMPPPSRVGHAGAGVRKGRWWHSGTIRLVSMPPAAGATRWSQRALCAVVGLTLGLLCAVLAATMSTGTSDMDSMSSTAGAPALSGEAAGAAARAPATQGTAVGAVSVISSMCDTSCVNEVTTTCAVAAATIIATLMVLLLASRRDTFLGLLARTRPTDFARRPRRARVAVPALSLCTLCVWRV